MTYIGVGHSNLNIAVKEEDAYEYAKQHMADLSLTEREDFVEFFFSGDWIKKEEE